MLIGYRVSGDMHRVVEGGIRKSGLVLLQMNNIKLALTESGGLLLADEESQA